MRPAKGLRKPPASGANEKRVFVFGSSTPRELSHIARVSRRQRLVHVKKEELPEETSNDVEVNSEPKRDIIYYMRQARSVTPATRDRQSSASKVSPSWAFGSSTPRELSHLVKVTPGQRVYNVKLSEPVAAPRSMTTSGIAEHYAGGLSHAGNRSTICDASSEPDIVQDRDFFSALWRAKRGEGESKNKQQAQNVPLNSRNSEVQGQNTPAKNQNVVSENVSSKKATKAKAVKPKEAKAKGDDKKLTEKNLTPNHVASPRKTYKSESLREQPTEVKRPGKIKQQQSVVGEEKTVGNRAVRPNAFHNAEPVAVANADDQAALGGKRPPASPRSEVGTKQANSNASVLSPRSETPPIGTPRTPKNTLEGGYEG